MPLKNRRRKKKEGKKNQALKKDDHKATSTEITGNEEIPNIIS